MNNLEVEYGKKLGKLLSFKTITNRNKEEFEKFYKEIKVMFPNVFEKGELVTGDLYFYVLVKGKNHNEPVLFMNHHDVVAADGKWDRDPFSGEVDDKRVYGRGAIDTKGGFFCMFEAMEELLASGEVPAQDTYLLSTADEEVGGEGAIALTKIFDANGVRLSCVYDEGGFILNDPIGMGDGLFAMLGLGEKTIFEFKATATSTGGHTSIPPRDNPGSRLAAFMSDVENSTKFTRKMSKTTVALFKAFSKKVHGPLKFVLAHPVLFAPILKAVSKKTPTLNAMFRTTITFTVFSGGTANNVIPTELSVVANVRIAKHEDSAYVYSVINELAKKHNVTITELTPPTDTGVTSLKNKYFNKIKEALKETYPDVIVAPYIATGGSDARHLRRIADNVYNFIPFQISKEQLAGLHGDNESVDIVTLPKAVNYYKYLMSK